MANETGSIVSSQDSDFYLTDVTEGFVNLTDLKDLVQHSTSSPCVPLFHTDKLCSFLKLPKPLLPALGVFMGNDFILTEDCDSLKMATEVWTVNEIAGYLRNFASLAEMIQDLKEKKIPDELINKIVLSLKEYDLGEAKTEVDDIFRFWKHQSDKQTFALSCLDYLTGLCKSRRVPGTIMNVYFNKIYMNKVQPEDMSQESTHQCSLHIRSFIWSLILQANEDGSDVVTEYGRAGTEYKAKQRWLNVDRQVDYLPLPEILCNSDNDKLSLVSLACGFDVKPIFERLSEKTLYALPLVALKYFINYLENNHKSLQWRYVKSLVACMVYQSEQGPPEVLKKHREDFDVKACHFYGQWQSALYYLNVLNSLIGHPMTGVKMQLLYRGTLCYSMLDRLSEGIL